MPNTKTPPPETLIDKIRKAFAQYQDTTSAILQDYIADDGLITELATADVNLLDELEELCEEAGDLTDFETIVKGLKWHHDLTTDTDKARMLVNLMDEDDVREFVKDESDMHLKVSNPFDRDKIENFLRENIYPYNINHRVEID